MQNASKKTVSLSLGSGGARGLTHIGIIRWLEAHNFEIQSIAGCSIGSLVGGIYAAGKLDELEKWSRAIRSSDMLTLLDMSWKQDGMFKGDKIINTLEKVVGKKNIEELSIPYTAIATDIDTLQEVRINSGNLFQAIRASISLPLIFTPHKIQGHTVVDGGLVNPVPVEPLINEPSDYLIAVNLCGIPEIQAPSSIKDTHKNHNNSNTFTAKISNFVDDIQTSMKSIGKFDWAAYDVMNKTIDAMQNNSANLRLSQHPVDVIINIPSNRCKIMDFDKADELITFGYEQAEKQLSHL
jgi:NTE family protein